MATVAKTMSASYSYQPHPYILSASANESASWFLTPLFKLLISLLRVSLQASGYIVAMRLTASGAYARPQPVPKMPPGLTEIMEDLTKSVIKHNPENVYEFCANHMAKLIEIRDGKPPRKPLTVEEKIKRAQKILKRRIDERRKQYDEEMEKFIQSQKEEIQEVHNDKAPVHHDQNLKDVSEIEIFHNIGEGKGLNNDAISVKTTTHDKPIAEINVSENTFNAIENGSNANHEKDISNDTMVTPLKKLVDVYKIEYRDSDPSNKSGIGNNESEEETVTKQEEVSLPDISENSPERNKENEVNLSDISEKLCEINKENELKHENISDYEKITESKINIKIPLSDEVARIDVNEDNVYSEIRESVEVNIENGIPDKVIDVTQSYDVLDSAADFKVSTEDNSKFIEKIHASENDELHLIKETVSDIESVKIIESEDHGNIPIEKGDISEHSDSMIANESIKKEAKSDLNSIIFKSNEKEKNSEDTKEKEPKFEDTKEKETKSEDTKDLNTVNDVSYSIEKVQQSEVDGKDLNYINDTSDQKQSNFSDTDSYSIDGHHELSSSSTDLNKFEEYTSQPKENISSIEPPTTKEKISNLNENDKELIENSIQPKEVNELTNTESYNTESEHNTTSSSNYKETNQKEHVDNEKSKHYDDTSDTLDNVSNISEVVTFDVDPTVTGKFDVVINPNEESADMVLDGDLESNRNPMDLETAAVTIQKVFRLYMFKSRCSTFDDTGSEEINDNGEDPDESEKKNEFTTTFSTERRSLGISRMDTVLQTVNEEKSLSMSTDDSSTLSSAATTIQAHVRGFLVRNKLNSNKSSSLINSLGNSENLESETDPHKNKTVLNIHIVPEGGHFLSRDESVLTSVELSLDGSPPSSVNLHPLGYDKNEPRKQLKREDAIQSISPPSNNSGKMSEDVDSIKDVLGDDSSELIKDEKTYCQIIDDASQSAPPQKDDSPNIHTNSSTNEDTILNDANEQQERKKSLEDISSIPENHDKLINHENIAENLNDNKERIDDVKSDLMPIFASGSTTLDADVNDFDSKVTAEPSSDDIKCSNVIKSNLKQDTCIDVENTMSLIAENKPGNLSVTELQGISQSEVRKHSLTKMSSDESDVVIASVKSTSSESNITSKLMHSGEFHDVVLPTKISRTDTSVVRGE